MVTWNKNNKKFVCGLQDESFNPNNTIPTIKHGRKKVLFFEGVSLQKGTGCLSKVNKKLYNYVKWLYRVISSEVECLNSAAYYTTSYYLDKPIC